MSSFVRVVLDDGEFKEFERLWEARRWILLPSKPERLNSVVYIYSRDPRDQELTFRDLKVSADFVTEGRRGAIPAGEGLEHDSRDEPRVRMNVMLFASQAEFLRSQPNLSAYLRKLIDDAMKK